MTVPYSVIEVFTSESARYQHKPVADAVVQFVHGLKIAARCVVLRGIGGCYENGEVASNRIEVLSFNMPLKIEIILPTPELDQVLPEIEKIVTDGIVVVEDMVIRSHKASKRLIPGALRVRDVMTPSPASITPETPVDEVVWALLSADYHGLPVVDEAHRPVGIVTQSDLISRAGIPVRLGLLEQFDQKKVDELVASLANKTADRIMSKPVTTIGEDDLLTGAVETMLDKGRKRLPVVNDDGKLVGMLSRLDVFRTITKESPNWNEMRKHNVQINEVHYVKDVMRTDVLRVAPDTPIADVLETIDSNDIQRVVVVDGAEKLLGMISDGDLLEAFSSHRSHFWDYLLSKVPFSDTAKQHREVLEHARARTAGEIMKTRLVTVSEDTAIDDAIRTMAGQSIKYLPVVGAEGVFKGMVTRDSLLRAGYSYPASR